MSGAARLFTTTIVVGAGLGGCRTDRVPYLGAPDRSPVGTYEWQFCAHSCQINDSAAGVITGVLVLDSVRIAVPDSQAEFFSFATAATWAIDLRNDHHEAGCFALRDPRRPPKRIGGFEYVHDAIPAVGLNNWRYGTDSTGLWLELYRSPDAFVDIHAQISGGRLAGITTAGGELQGADAGIRHIVGRRVGPPRPNLCFAAAPGRWTRARMGSSRVPSP